MADGHCFISYSHADGLEFVTKLANELEGGHPFIKVWFEKREMVGSRDDWDDQLAKAIQQCKCLLFVMSKDSTGGHSNCKDEWTWALKYKKPVVCLWIDNEAEDQFRLNSRQKIEFTQNFDAGLAKLRKTIAYLDSPEGQLEELRHRLADANRDLHRATEEEKPRIEAEIEELNAKISQQEEIVKNPKKAAEQTQKNIETGLERERQPKLPKVGIQSTKFINPPPGIAPNYFQDRTVETKQVLDFLHDDAQRLMTIVGRGGVGKTAMICRLLKHLENDAVPEDVLKAFADTKPTKVDGIVYLSESGSHRVNFANIFYDLCKLLPSEVANALDAVYKNPQGSTESKVHALLEKFDKERVVLLLDNFEPLVNSETFDIQDTELNEALTAFLNGPHTEVNIIITTRIAPKVLNLIQPGRQRPLDLDDGLESPYAENILREMDSDRRLGLKAASDELLNTARIRTRGFPKALEALFAILSSDRYTTLEEILNTAEHYLPENVVEALVGEAFNRLDTNAQKVMQALAVYNRPVTPAAVDYLLAPHIPAMDSAPILQRLTNMHFSRKEGRYFYLHPVDREFAFSLLPKGDEIVIDENAQAFRRFGLQPPRKERNDFTQIGLTARAADYFAQARKPRAEWKKLDDLSAQLAEFDLRCAAGDYDSAVGVLSEIDYDYLLLWGHYRLMIQMHEKITGKINDTVLQMQNLNGLGLAYQDLGASNKSIAYYEQGVQVAKVTNNRQAEGTFLGNLGNAYVYLSNIRMAIPYKEQSLKIFRDLGDRKGEANSLNWLGNCILSLGQIEQALNYYKESLEITKAIQYKRGEAWPLSNIGECYAILDDLAQSMKYLTDAKNIFYEIGHRRGESICITSIGDVFLLLQDYKRAEQNYLDAIQIADEILNPETQESARNGLAQVCLFQNDLTNARAYAENALQYDIQNDSYGTSNLHGIIALRQGMRSRHGEPLSVR